MTKLRETDQKASKERTKTLGRPQIFDPDFHPARCIELGKQGKSVVEICCDFDIHKDTYYDWIKKFKIFSDAHKKSNLLKEQWFISLGLEITRGEIKGSNVTAYIWLTKQICGWRDKVEFSTQEDPEWEQES